MVLYVNGETDKPARPGSFDGGRGAKEAIRNLPMVLGGFWHLAAWMNSKSETLPPIETIRITLILFYFSFFSSWLLLQLLVVLLAFVPALLLAKRKTCGFEYGK